MAFSWSKGRFFAAPAMESLSGMQGALKIEPSMTEGMLCTNTASHRRITAPAHKSVHHIRVLYLGEYQATYSCMRPRSL